VRPWLYWRTSYAPSENSPTCSNHKELVVSRLTGFADLAGKRVGIFGYGVEGRATRRRLEDVAESSSSWTTRRA